MLLLFLLLKLLLFQGFKYSVVVIEHVDCLIFLRCSVSRCTVGVFGAEDTSACASPGIVILHGSMVHSKESRSKVLQSQNIRTASTVFLSSVSYLSKKPDKE